MNWISHLHHWLTSTRNLLAPAFLIPLVPEQIEPSHEKTLDWLITSQWSEMEVGQMSDLNNAKRLTIIIVALSLRIRKPLIAGYLGECIDSFCDFRNSYENARAKAPALFTSLGDFPEVLHSQLSQQMSLAGFANPATALSAPDLRLQARETALNFALQSFCSVAQRWCKNLRDPNNAAADPFEKFLLQFGQNL